MTMPELRKRLKIRGIDSDLEYVVREGIAYVLSDDLAVIPLMISLGASPSERLNTVPMREALKHRIRNSNALTEPQKCMALRLIGGTDDTRDKTLDGRLEAVGAVVFQGKTVGIDAVRRWPKGRRYDILGRLFDDLIRGELDARRAAGLEPMPEVVEGIEPCWATRPMHMESLLWNEES
jgi:hypothetical protein